MSKVRRKYEEVFKREAVRLADSGEKSAREVGEGIRVIIREQSGTGERNWMRLIRMEEGGNLRKRRRGIVMTMQ